MQQTLESAYFVQALGGTHCPFLLLSYKQSPNFVEDSNVFR